MWLENEGLKYIWNIEKEWLFRDAILEVLNNMYKEPSKIRNYDWISLLKY